jgi:hypothetical protein
MIRIVSRIAALTCGVLGLMGCADVNDFLVRNVLMDEEAGGGQIVQGRLHSMTTAGDVFEFPCKADETGKSCTAVLIRDSYLRDNYVELNGKTLTLRVERTNACHDTRSSLYACKTSKDGTAFLILQWIDPAIGFLGGLG